MALRYSGIKVELREIELKNKPQPMLLASPKGTVPVLCISRGNGELQVIDESMEVMMWALETNDPGSWFYRLDEGEKLGIKKLIEENDLHFKPCLDQYKYSSRFPEHPPEFYRKQCDDFLLKLELLLVERSYLMSENITLADIAIFPFVRQFSLVDKNWFDQSEYIRIQAWLSMMVDMPLFNIVMGKYAPWLEGQSSVVEF